MPAVRRASNRCKCWICARVDHIKAKCPSGRNAVETWLDEPTGRSGDANPHTRARVGTKA